ncbi:unnamed protein product, partial [Nesidiocoris tenuis]
PRRRRRRCRRPRKERRRRVIRPKGLPRVRRLRDPQGLLANASGETFLEKKNRVRRLVLNLILRPAGTPSQKGSPYPPRLQQAR